jgi:hypothetical protein
VRQPVTSPHDPNSHIGVWSHTPRARIPVPPQRADGFDSEARPFARSGLFFVGFEGFGLLFLGDGPPRGAPDGPCRPR